MLNMGGSCSEKNKRNLEFVPVKEPVSLSLYRGIFKTLKELERASEHEQKRRDWGRDIRLLI